MRFLVTIVWTFLLSFSFAQAEQRIALVIGNGAYPVYVGELPNPTNDARLMAKTLRDLDFDVIEVLDGGEKDMKRAIRDFGKKLNDAGRDGVGLFYYAGHGLQVKGTNYLIPIDAEIETEGDVDLSAITVDSVLGMMEFSQVRLSFIVLDACRNNPFARGFRSVTRGLARMDAPQGSLVAYATAPGDVAADGEGENSPYTSALAQGLKSSLPVEQMFREVRNSVMEQTDKRQTPWESSSLTGDNFYFNPQAQKVTASAKPVQSVQSTPVSQPQVVYTPDMLAWQTIQDSGNPDELRQFILAFPDSPFVGIAEARLNSITETVIEQRVQSLSTTSAVSNATKEERDAITQVSEQAKASRPPETAIASLVPPSGSENRVGKVHPRPKLQDVRRQEVTCGKLDSGEYDFLSEGTNAICFAYEMDSDDAQVSEINLEGPNGVYGVFLRWEKRTRPLLQLERMNEKTRAERLNWIGLDIEQVRFGKLFEFGVRYDDGVAVIPFTPVVSEQACFLGNHGSAFKHDERKNADHSGYRHRSDFIICHRGRVEPFSKEEIGDYLARWLPE